MIIVFVYANDVQYIRLLTFSSVSGKQHFNLIAFLLTLM